MQLHRAREEFEAAGAGVIAIGQGTPEQAASFREGQGIAIDLLVDPDRRTYAIAGAKVATMGELFSLGALKRGLAARRESGVMQGMTQGHPAQLGGVLVVDVSGRIAYAHMASEASDLPAMDEVLKAARAAVG